MFAYRKSSLKNPKSLKWLCFVRPHVMLLDCVRRGRSVLCKSPWKQEARAQGRLWLIQHCIESFTAQDAGTLGRVLLARLPVFQVAMGFTRWQFLTVHLDSVAHEHRNMATFPMNPEALTPKSTADAGVDFPQVQKCSGLLCSGAKLQDKFWNRTWYQNDFSCLALHDIMSIPRADNQEQREEITENNFGVRV